MYKVSVYASLICPVFSVIQQFSGATVIRGYVVKMFGSIFHRSALSDVGGNLTALCECDCATGHPVSQSAYLSAIIIGRETFN